MFAYQIGQTLAGRYIAFLGGCITEDGDALDADALAWIVEHCKETGLHFNDGHIESAMTGFVDHYKAAKAAETIKREMEAQA